MNNREDILATIQKIMVEMFEMDPAAITLEARLDEAWMKPGFRQHRRGRHDRPSETSHRQNGQAGRF